MSERGLGRVVDSRGCRNRRRGSPGIVGDVGTRVDVDAGIVGDVGTRVDVDAGIVGDVETRVDVDVGIVGDVGTTGGAHAWIVGDVETTAGVDAGTVGVWERRPMSMGERWDSRCGGRRDFDGRCRRLERARPPALVHGLRGRLAPTKASRSRSAP
jgi:hypothetical protein